MGGAANRISIFDAAGQEDWPSLSKAEVARRLAGRIAAALSPGTTAATVLAPRPG
jgi:phosphopantothenoylcysteine decarboxylase/phosphopantothenate--cysteine ligase